MTAKRAFLTLALAVTMLAPAGLAQAVNIEFAAPGLLGTSFSAPSGSAGSYSLNSYGLNGVAFSLNGYSWYGSSSSSWVPGYNPGAGSPAGIYMTNFRGEYGLAVGAQAGSGSLGSLPGTGVNELDSLESLVVTFNQPVYLNSVTLGNFYNDTNSLTGNLEKGWLVFDGQYALPYNFTSPAGQFVNGAGTGDYAGTLVITLPAAIQVTSVAFFAMKQYDSGWSSDYLVRAVDVSKTPEPASMILMGSAAGLMWLRRRRRS